MNIKEIKKILYSEKIAQHIIQKISALELYKEPFQHGIINGFLPDKFYNDIDTNFLDYKTNEFIECSHKQRFQYNLLTNNTENDALSILQLVFKKFGKNITSAFFNKFNIKKEINKTEWQCSLVWNKTTKQPINCIKPHLDIKRKIISLVLYLPFKDQKIPGTDILKQNNNGTFDIVRTAAADPNSCIVFEKTDYSWHQARPTSSDRRTITCFINHLS